MRVLTDDQTLIDNTQTCTGHNVGESTPHHIVECRNVYHTVVGHPAQDGYKLEITFVSQTGGYKTIRNEVTNAVSNRTFQGTSHESEKIEIHFDLQKPLHCIHAPVDPCTFEDSPALAMYPDNIQVNICILVSTIVPHV